MVAVAMTVNPTAVAILAITVVVEVPVVVVEVLAVVVEVQVVVVAVQVEMGEKTRKVLLNLHTRLPVAVPARKREGLLAPQEATVVIAVLMTGRTGYRQVIETHAALIYLTASATELSSHERKLTL